MMILATINDLETVRNIVCDTIREVYPNYYPQEVVEFFINHHSQESISQDIKDAKVYLLFENNECVGTGTIDRHYMNRVFVSETYQRKGYGSKIMDFIEEKIAKTYTEVVLDSSLPAFNMYLKRGYKAIEFHEKVTQNGRVLCYQVMKKDVYTVDRSSLNLNKRIFKSTSNTDNGEVSAETIFHYYQEGDGIWASYSGGKINRGFLIGKFIEDKQIYFTYQHINDNKEIRCGECKSTLEHLPDGRLLLHESWQWLDSERIYGNSVIEEVILS